MIDGLALQLYVKIKYGMSVVFYDKVYMSVFIETVRIWISAGKSRRENQSNLNPVTRSAIDLIGENLCKKVDIAFLAKKIHVSPSYLSHIFKNDLHISIHKYVLEKRLILANKKIRQSVNPTVAASESGFADYSGFYRQYKKMFGVSPAKSKTKADSE